MSVTTHSLEITPQADGQRSVTLRMFDQDGVEVSLTTALLDSVINIDVWVAGRIADQNLQLELAEYENIIGNA